jgi:hypothetical protein
MSAHHLLANNVVLVTFATQADRSAAVPSAEHPASVLMHNGVLQYVAGFEHGYLMQAQAADGSGVNSHLFDPRTHVATSQLPGLH